MLWYWKDTEHWIDVNVPRNHINDFAENDSFVFLYKYGLQNNFHP